jgi:hypothetical protein
LAIDKEKFERGRRATSGGGDKMAVLRLFCSGWWVCTVALGFGNYTG